MCPTLVSIIFLLGGKQEPTTFPPLPPEADPFMVILLNFAGAKYAPVPSGRQPGS